VVRRAAIDVGTNSVRLLVADVLDAAPSSPRLRPVLRHLAITRLGEGLTPGGRLRAAAAARTAEAVRRCLALARAAGAATPTLVGTYALRTAQNPRLLLSRLGRPLRVLDGDEEARLGYDGVLAGLTSPRRPAHALVVDIGGGSVELTWGRGRRIVAARSLPAGAVVLTERFLAHDPPRRAELAALRRHLARLVDPHLPAVRGDPRRPAPWRRSPRVFGVGGTITTIAAIVQRLCPYDPDRVHGFRLSGREVARVIRTLVAMPLAARRRIPGLQPERADIIVAGALVLEHVLQKVGVRAITVSEADLLWALVLNETPAEPVPRARGRSSPRA
jgi:exopolyphosphatase / guanosine-5'-triphosphate,3'-diphosphate pyrophosphatase